MGIQREIFPADHRHYYRGDIFSNFFPGRVRGHFAISPRLCATQCISHPAVKIFLRGMISNAQTH